MGLSTAPSEGGNTGATTQQDEPSNWSKQRCVSVLSMWMNMCFCGITMKGLGVMLPTLQIQFDTKAWVIGWMTSIILAMLGVVGPFASFIGRRFGIGVVSMASGVLMGGGFILGSFANTPFQLTLILTFISGPGLGLTDILTKECVARYFKTNYATATGIARTGVSFALIVAAPLVQLFLNTYGWRGTMLLIGGILLHSVVSGALLVSVKAKGRNNDYDAVPQDEGVLSVESKGSCISRFYRFLKMLFKNLDLELLSMSRFWIVTVIACCNKFAFEMWIIYFVSQAYSTGFTLEDASTFVMVAGFGNIIAKLGQGLIVDKAILPAWVLMSSSILVSSIFLIASPYLTGYWGMMTASFFILLCDGILSCITDVITKELLGVELLAGAFAWFGVIMIGVRILTGFLPGLMYDTLGDYRAAFILLGSVQLFPLFLIVILRYKQYLG